MDVIFYNHFHNGDTHFSRNFIKYIISVLPDNNYYFSYSNYCNSNNLQDIHQLKPLNNIVPQHLEKQIVTNTSDQKILINTWIGCDGQQHLRVGGGCNLKSNISLYKTIFKELQISFPDNTDCFIPTINYNKFDIKNIDTMLKKINKKRILFCNGLAHSGQSINFPMQHLIQLAVNKNYEVFYTCREPVEINQGTLISTITQKNTGDLNEISYLSTKCDIIVGRSSGPHVFTFVKDNLDRENLINITFTNSENEKNFCEGKCTNIWSNSSNFAEWIDILNKAL